MGFFESFRTKMTFGLDGESELSDFAHKRYHARYIVNDRGLCTIEHSRHGLFRVVDLSHHGCLVEPVSDSSFDACSFPALVDLSVCGSTIRLEVSECQRRKNGWGVVFRHVHESSIRNLSQFIVPLRLGSSVVALPSDPGKDGVMSKLRRRFVGEGPFELVFEKNESGKTIFMMATIRYGQVDGSVIWDNGRVMTKKSFDHEGARMALTTESDQGLVWLSAVACLGIKFTEGAICAKILHDWLSAHAMPVLAKSS